MDRIENDFELPKSNVETGVSAIGSHKRIPMPDWLRINMKTGFLRKKTEKAIEDFRLETVCREARCPNRSKCFSAGVATVMILGRNCTRNCAFCAVEHGKMNPPDPDEPHRVAGFADFMGLNFIVVTSVTRDDLPDGGASQFADVVREVKRKLPGCGVELLVPDFGGRIESVDTVLEAEPDVFGHNIETVPGLYERVRPGADYKRSLNILKYASMTGEIPVKSGIMTGLGETRREISDTLEDLRAAGCSMLTIGQYLRPGPGKLPVERYYTPEEFDDLKEIALDLGFRSVESAPLVRSSYMAHEQWMRLSG
jgi:lipoic acid synthetase